MQPPQTLKRYSPYIRNRIINLFKLGYRIYQIQLTIKREDNLKLTRDGIARIVKLFETTNSIIDLPKNENRESKVTQQHLAVIDHLILNDRQITAAEIRDELSKNMDSTFHVPMSEKLSVLIMLYNETK